MTSEETDTAALEATYRRLHRREEFEDAMLVLDAIVRSKEDAHGFWSVAHLRSRRDLACLFFFANLNFFLFPHLFDNYSLLTGRVLSTPSSAGSLSLSLSLSHTHTQRRRCSCATRTL